MSTVSILCWFVLNAAFTFNCGGFTCEWMHVLLNSAKLVKTAYKKCFNVKEKKPSYLFHSWYSTHSLLRPSSLKGHLSLTDKTAKPNCVGTGWRVIIQVDNRLWWKESPQLGNACCVSLFFIPSYIYKQKLWNGVIVVSEHVHCCLWRCEWNCWSVPIDTRKNIVNCWVFLGLQCYVKICTGGDILNYFYHDASVAPTHSRVVKKEAVH